jgi:hypothetical protein
MRLFAVPAGRRVRITSRQIYWKEHDEVKVLAEKITWSGTTTGDYWVSVDGVERRLITDHSLGFHENSGVWQRDIECEVIG